MSSVHPTSLELIDYAYGWLSPARTDAITVHLAHCPFCRIDTLVRQDYLDTLAGTLPVSASTPATDTIVAQVQRWIAHLVSRPSLALAGAEADDESPLLYEVNGIQIALRVIEEPESALKTLMGLITGVEGDSNTVQLRHPVSGTEVARAAVDAAGQFSLLIKPTDPYRLVLVTPELEIHIPTLPL